MQIGRAIYKLRNEAKLTQAQFAETLGVPQQSVQKWEKGSALPDLEKLVMISKRFGVSQRDCFARIHREYDEFIDYNWCHTIPNAMIVVASLLYGKGDYAKSICMSVETGFDTDCNGATVGSVLGMANGISAIPEYWTRPIHDTLMTTITLVGTVKVSDRVKLTLEHIKKKENLDKPLRLW